MTEFTLSPIAAYDILADGSARPLSEPWPKAEPGDGATWRWVHCDRTAAGFSAWAAEMLPNPVRRALLQVETRPRCDIVHEGLLLTLRGINLNPGAEGEDMVALRLWVTGRLIVSTRHRKLIVIKELREEIDVGRCPTSPAAFVSRLSDKMTARIEEISLAREEATDSVEEILLDDEPDAIGTGEREVSKLSRSVIKLRRHVAPQREALTKLAQADLPFVGPAERYDLREVANRTLRSVEELDATRERLASLRAHIDSLHNARMGRQGMILSIVAAIFLPLGFLTGLFGVNVAGMPGTDWMPAFGVLSAGMVLMGLVLWLFFRWMKWF